MLWEIETRPLAADAELRRVAAEFDLLTHSRAGATKLAGTARGYLVEGTLTAEQADRLRAELLADPLVESSRVSPLESADVPADALTVLYLPGVMDPTALSVVEAAENLGIVVESVRTFRRYFPAAALSDADRDLFARKILCNAAIEQVVAGPLSMSHLGVGAEYAFKLVTVPLLEADDDALMKLSREGGLALNLVEMKTVQAHFRDLGRDPTDIELESVAQTWSEHCSHKTLKGRIDFDGRVYENLLKETIFGATVQVRKNLGPKDFCVSVFVDNAGVVTFDDEYHVCFKVETHNRPSAIEPYGGANTGIGGVIRDPLGTGLGAKPVCNTDVFCFAPPDTDPAVLPPGVLHPRKIMDGVVAGVRDYGNRMGIPTVNGAVCFDERYLANPLVFCGTVGLIPVGKTEKAARPGDLIVAVGGRTGRDGIHGATFSSAELSEESEKISGGAVQIGNAIAEKKVLDVILQARDAGLYTAITDCGAGGFSSAVGEMGADLGARVDLDKAPLKYAGLSYTEIWISESQERMILAVPPENVEALVALCGGEDVEAVVLGEFEATGKLRLFYDGNAVGELDMHFLHDGRPDVTRKATDPRKPATIEMRGAATNAGDILLKILASPNVASKEFIIRQYDHEVQGGSVIKPLVGPHHGPGDAAVVMPVLGRMKGFAVGCGLNPHYGDLDPYAMAANAIDEAIRNVVCVGADPARVSILDNFCWGNTDRPEVLGSLVLAAQACADLAVALGTPFISGKDSLKNEFVSGSRHIVIPPTLLISALGLIDDVRACVSMDLKGPGNHLYLVGTTRNETGGSHLHLVTGGSGGAVPKVDPATAKKTFAAVHAAISSGLVRSCHDLSEGGLAVAAAEMALAGGVGADLTSVTVDGLDDLACLFSESATRFLVEVRPDKAAAFEAALAGVACRRVGVTVKEKRLRIAGASGEWVVWSALDALEKAWKRTLDF